MKRIKADKPDLRPGMMVRVCDGYMDAGHMGRIMAEPFWAGQWWVPIAFNDEDEPTLYKAAALTTEMKS